MEENINIIRFCDNYSDLEAIGELYCVTFSTTINYSLEDKENAIKNIKKHTSYEGFKGFKAVDDKGNIVGFTYGYTSLPEQFYRQKIAEQLSKKEINIWLNYCFEFVEIAVSPSYKRSGIGSKLHDAILERNKHKTSVLTTGIDNSPAINLYGRKGWKLIKKDAPVISEDNLQVIMGKEIN
ncbi:MULTISPECIES: GNAT family N-acetyltransferase [Paraliobacillus]|uniref:GNAT family N-acetyltransferase n=1 Tax=Paraliobacillus TaxID=200903 RepID=UPI001300948B|nr:MULTISPECIES: GNAT family N-acetyltransferase [Paraliobacillus]